MRYFCIRNWARRPKGVRTTERETITRKMLRLVFPRVSAISFPCASFLHTFFWQDRKKYARGATVTVAQKARHYGEYEKMFRACGAACALAGANRSGRRNSTPASHVDKPPSAMLKKIEKARSARFARHAEKEGRYRQWEIEKRRSS